MSGHELVQRDAISMYIVVVTMQVRMLRQLHKQSMHLLVAVTGALVENCKGKKQ